MFAAVTFTNTLNSWASAWSTVMIRITVDAAVLLVVVGLIWLPLRRRISSQLTIGLFSLVLLKLAVPIPLVLPGSIARYWPSARLTPEFTVGAVPRSPSSKEAIRAADRGPDDGSLAAQIPRDTGRLPTDIESLKTNVHREAVSSAARSSPATGSTAAVVPPAVLQPAHRQRLTITAIVMLVWAAVVAILIGRLIKTNLSFFLKVRRAKDVDPATLPVGWSGRPSGLARSIPVAEIEDLTAPAAWGLLRPRILMPSGLIQKMQPQPLTWVLLHELMHIRRGDLWLNIFERLVQIVYFFHPAVWVATRVINVHREFACDDASLALRLDIPRKECGQVLVWIAEQAQAHRTSAAIAPAQGLFGSYTFIQKRLLRILDTDRPLSTRLSRGAAVLLVGLAVLTLPYVRAKSEIAARPERQETSVATPQLTKDVTEKPQEPQSPVTKNVPADARTRLRTMEIRVINARTNQPEPGVTIRASFNIIAEGVTDAEGHYRLTAAASRFRILALSFRKRGFVPLRVMWNDSFSETPVEIPIDYTVKLEPGSTIGGLVKDENGNPVVGAGPCFRPVYWNARRRHATSRLRQFRDYD